MATADSFDPGFQVSLPLPLARLYTRAYHAKSPRDRHDLAFHLLEASLKLSAAALVARYRNRGNRLSKVDAALEHLALPSLGHWREIFVESLSFLSNARDGDPWAQRIRVPPDELDQRKPSIIPDAGVYRSAGSAFMR